MATQNFEDTDAGRFLLNAVQYLSMARLVTDTETYRAQPRLFNRPLLNTLGVGVEVFLKSVHLSLGKTMDDMKSYGHRLDKLWDDAPELIRDRVLQAAEKTNDDFQAEGIAPARTVNFRDDFVESLRNLSGRHHLGGSQLRYLAPAGTLATRPGLLIYAFHAVAMDCLKRPPFGL